MKEFGKPSLGALLLCILFFNVIESVEISDSLQKLRDLREQDGNRVVYLNDELVRNVFGKGAREYKVLVFFHVSAMDEQNPSLKLKQLKEDFILIAKTFYKTHIGTAEENSVFFCIADIKNTKMAFEAFKVETLPNVILTKETGKKQPLPWEQYPRTAEGIAQFLTAETGIPVGEIERPPLLSTLQMVVIGVFFLSLLPFFIKFILSNKTPLHNPWTWCLGGLFIYFFSSSGGMFDIIRGMPFSTRDRENPSKIIYWYSSSGAQFWAEGFAIGSLYLAFGLLLSLVTFLTPHLKNAQIQRGVVLTSVVICFWAVKQLVYLDNWKTGYSIHGYFPKSWR